MANYTDVQSRDTLNVPQDISYAIIQDAAKSSAALALGRRVPMSTKQSRVSVIDVLPDAYWVSGDTGLKQTTKMSWAPIWMEAEPIAALVVIPDEYAADSAVPLWDEIRPRVAEAIAKKLDAAVFYGIEKPATWTSPYIYKGVVDAGNVVSEGAGADLAVDIASVGALLSQDDISLNGWAVSPGFNWKLSQIRSTATTIPVFQPSLQTGVPGSLYGMPMQEVRNGAWDSTKMSVLGGDWSKLIIGVRQDITYSIHQDAVITDDTGKVVFNAMQQDSKIMRVVARFGYMVIDNTTSLTDRPFPFAALRPAGAPAS